MLCMKRVFKLFASFDLSSSTTKIRLKKKSIEDKEKYLNRRKTKFLNAEKYQW